MLLPSGTEARTSSLCSVMVVGGYLKVSNPPEETSLMLEYTDFVCT